MNAYPYKVSQKITHTGNIMNTPANPRLLLVNASWILPSFWSLAGTVSAILCLHKLQEHPEVTETHCFLVCEHSFPLYLLSLDREGGNYCRPTNKHKCTLLADSVTDAYLCGSKTRQIIGINPPESPQLRGKVWSALTGTAFKSLNCPPSNIYWVCFLRSWETLVQVSGHI